jgi:hypothetical protein
MASNDATVLTEAAFRELRRAYHQQRQQLRNLTTRLTAINKGRHHAERFRPPRIRFKNESGETAPAWAVMRMTLAPADKDYIPIQKPDATYRWLYLVNGNRDVAASAYGYGHFLTSETFTPKRGRVLYDTGATPAYGEHWGPKSGEWKLFQHRPGFFILGGTTGSGSTARVAAIQMPPSEILIFNDSGSSKAADRPGARRYGDK